MRVATAGRVDDVIEATLQQFTMLGIHGQFGWFDLPHVLMIIGCGSYPVAGGPLLAATRTQLCRRIAHALG